MPLSLSHLGFGYLMDVVRPDLGCDGESWHRSKPLQRCKLKITGLCKLCTQGCIMLELTQTLHLHSFSFQLLKPLGFEVVVTRTFKNLRKRGNSFSVVLASP